MLFIFIMFILKYLFFFSKYEQKATGIQFFFFLAHFTSSITSWTLTRPPPSLTVGYTLDINASGWHTAYENHAGTIWMQRHLSALICL